MPGRENEPSRKHPEARFRSNRGWQSSAQFAAQHQVGKDDCHTQRNDEYHRIHGLKIAHKRQLQHLCYENVTKKHSKRSKSAKVHCFYWNSTEFEVNSRTKMALCCHFRIIFRPFGRRHEPLGPGKPEPRKTAISLGKWPFQSGCGGGI